MWKLLSGIALVVLLDVAFIWMMASETDPPEIARSIGPTSAAPIIHPRPIHEPVAIDDSAEPIDGDRYDIDRARESRVSKRSSGNASRVAQPETAAVAATAPARLFQDTIIWIGRTEVPVKIDDREELPIETERQHEIQATIAEPRIEKKKRSFESKAFGVIKKPYDWVKSLADKFH